MIMLFGLFAEQGLSLPTVEKFAWFYSLKSNKNDEGFYYFSEEAGERVAGRSEDQGQYGSLEGIILLGPS